MSSATLLDRRGAPTGIVPYPGPPPVRPEDLPPSDPRGRARRSRGPGAVPLLAGLAAIAGLVPARALWPAQLALLALLLTVPGLALLRALRVPRLATAATPVYVPAASIAVLVSAGLAVDGAGPPLGVEAPLRTVPLLLGVEALCLLLVAAGAIGRAPSGRRVPIRMPGVRRLWPLLVPLASAAGAARLTDGHGAAVAIAATVCAVALLVASILAAPRLDTAQLALVLYGVGLALAWSFSLRSGTVYGFDISGELPIAELTREVGVWHAAHPGDAYGAMLSLTILPALLQALTGISSLVLLKAVYPALFALFPVAVFLLARRHLPARYAFAGAAFVVVQANFAQQLPAVARQEIGLMLFAVLVAAALDRRLPRGSRAGLAAALAAALVVSHYSTTSMAIVLLAGAVAAQALLFVARRRPRLGAGVAAALVVLTGGAALWYGPVTHSGDNLTRFADSVRADGLQLLPGRTPGQGILGAYLGGNMPVRASAAEYSDLAHAEYVADRGYVVPLPDAGARRYALRDASVPAAAARAPGAKARLDRAQLLIVQAVNLLAVLGALVLAVRRRACPGLRAAALLGVGAVVALAFIRLSGTVAESYNQDRALIQALVPLAVVLAWVGASAARGARRLAPAVAVAVALAIGVVGANTSGLAAAAFTRPATNLSDRGEDMERYYVTSPELASAEWLRAARYRGGVVYTDRYGQLRLISRRVPTDGLLLDLTPRTLDQHAWIYASAVNTVDGRARGTSGNRYATFRFPRRFIEDHWDTVYANGSSEVFHR